MPIGYLLYTLWHWIADKGITLALILVIACMVPRVGRFLIREINSRIESTQDEQDSKTSLALTTAAVYIGQLVVYFLLMVAFLSTLGFSLAGAAIPATVVSAAVGLGAQSIIADFLAGFFILTEKQYGINDWVRFEGSGLDKVEGSVISITLRATRIRTLSQETITIPNSTAKVCVNNSQFWSRAVVVMPVPLDHAGSTQETIARATRAAERALAHEDVRCDVLEELVVQPAVDVAPPATVGMPWTMSIRLMVKSNAGSQWAIERAIRTEILDEFWEEYGHPASLTGADYQALSAPSGAEASAGGPRAQGDTAIRPGLAAAGQPTEAFGAPRTASTQPVSDARAAAGNGAHGTAAPQADEALPATEALAGWPQTEVLDAQGRRVGAGTDDDSEHLASDSGDPAAQQIPGSKAAQEPEDKPSGWLSLGGRVRPSTTALGIALAVLLILSALTVQTSESWEGGDGWLAPRNPAPQTATPTTSSPATSVEDDYPAATTTSQTTQSYPTDTAVSSYTRSPEDRSRSTAGETVSSEPTSPEVQEPSATQIPTPSQPTQPGAADSDPGADLGAEHPGLF
ncbi:hypothetical protein CATYP_06140 [Corynebacterium atypicum]|uniref:Mechanosensitive ion channel MscS domain-containing protein n=1 Tax=Corynebacterium atypicum TaxID=191610 RepID=A0ABN4DD32_9CORY|nr:mechanosensitive ion channel domain-containing protein [Corynebacterium atypicum]AIG64263.1 hypothetical protein CATYP_06140 [Corynebacterium atypicum]